jgi:hypothetical protein
MHENDSKRLQIIRTMRRLVLLSVALASIVGTTACDRHQGMLAEARVRGAPDVALNRHVERWRESIP